MKAFKVIEYIDKNTNAEMKVLILNSMNIIRVIITFEIKENELTRIITKSKDFKLCNSKYLELINGVRSKNLDIIYYE